MKMKEEKSREETVEMKIMWRASWIEEMSYSHLLLLLCVQG